MYQSKHLNRRLMAPKNAALAENIVLAFGINSDVLYIPRLS
jgi:hypothetical protein